MLTVSSYPTRTSVVLRGKFILDNILGSPVPPPPPDVPPLDEAAVGKIGVAAPADGKASRRPRLRLLPQQDGPARVSAWKTTTPSASGAPWTANFPVDSSGTLPNGKSFSTPAEMRDAAHQPACPSFRAASPQKMLTYALERGLQPYDRRTVADIKRKLAAETIRFQTLIYEIVHSLPFQIARRRRQVAAAGRPWSVQAHGMLKRVTNQMTR